MNNWLDSHCHLNDDAFDDDINDVLNRMVQDGVTRCMLVSCSVADYLKGLKINNPNIQIKRAL